MTYEITEIMLNNIEEYYNKKSLEYEKLKQDNYDKDMDLLLLISPKYEILGMQVVLDILEIQYEILENTTVKFDKSRKYKITPKTYEELKHYCTTLSNESKRNMERNYLADTIEEYIETDEKICICGKKIDGVYAIINFLELVFNIVNVDNLLEIQKENENKENKEEKTKQTYYLYKAMCESIIERKILYSQYVELIEEYNHAQNKMEIIKQMGSNNIALSEEKVKMLKEKIDESKARQIELYKEIAIYKDEVLSKIENYKYDIKEMKFEKDIKEV